jgi:hypothetical protein
MLASVAIGNELPLVLIAGPCQLESRDHAFAVAGTLKDMAARLGIGLVYKTSFDKANRTSLAGRRGVGLEGALGIFADLRTKLDLPVLTDVHEAGQCAELASVVDVLQIPAFLCRQTDLLVAAARTGKPVNVKKGQFLAPWDMRHVVDKITGIGQRGRAGDRARRVVRLQCAGVGHARAAAACRTRRSGRLRRHPFGASSGRPRGRVGRRAAPRRGAGAGCRRDRDCGGVHRDPRGSRQRAVGRTQHGGARRFAGTGRAADGLRPPGQGIQPGATP